MIEMRTLGSVQVQETGPGGRSTLDLQPKRLAVLVYLAVARRSALHPRDVLLALFWPLLDPEHARAALRKTLYLLREKVGRDAVLSRGAKIGIASEHLRCDVADFREALDAGDEARALELYRGDLLAGFHVGDAPGFERWLDMERAQLKREALAAARALSERAEAAGTRAEAVRWARRATEIDALDERALRRLLEALHAAGNRAAAVRTYETFRKRMRDALDLEPAPQTRELIEMIRRGDRLGATVDSSPDSPADGPRAGTERSERARPTDTAAPEAPGQLPSGGHTPGNEASAGEGSARPAVAGEREANPSWWRPAGVLTLAVTVTVALLLFLGSDFLGSDRAATTGSGGASPAAERSVAVLPFESLGPEGGERYFVEGVREVILSSLSGVQDIVVVSPGSLDLAGRAAGGLDRVGAELGVAHVLLGSVQRTGERLRITIRLVRADTERQVWADQFDREYTADALFDVQNRIAREVVGALQARLTPAESQRLARRPTDDITAYDYYLRGRERLGYLLDDRIADRGRVEAAIRLFRHALELDRDFAPAHAGIASAFGDLPGVNGDLSWMDSMQAAATRAVELDPELAEAHLALAEFHRKQVGPDHERAYLASARRAVELRPNDPRAIVEIGRYWFERVPGPPRLDRFLCWMERAVRLDPTDPELHRALAFAYWHLGELAAAEAEAKRALKLEPDALRTYRDLVLLSLLREDRPGAMQFYRTARGLARSAVHDRYTLGEMELALGMLDSARVHLTVAERAFRRPWPSRGQLLLAYALWETGHREQTADRLYRLERRARWSIEQGRVRYEPEFDLAEILAIRGETDAAVDFVAKAVEQGWRRYFRIVPELDGPMRKLWGNERFDSLMAEVRVEVDSMRSRVEREGCEAIRELPEPEDLTAR